MKRKFEWPIVIEAETITMDLKRARMRRTVEGLGRDVVELMYEALASRKNGGLEFHGEVITATSPMGVRTVRIWNPDTLILEKE